MKLRSYIIHHFSGNSIFKALRQKKETLLGEQGCCFKGQTMWKKSQAKKVHECQVTRVFSCQRTCFLVACFSYAIRDHGKLMRCLWCSELSQIARTAVTKCHKLSGLNKRHCFCLTVLETRGLTSGCWWYLVPSVHTRKDMFEDSFLVSGSSLTYDSINQIFT